MACSWSFWGQPSCTLRLTPLPSSDLLGSLQADAESSARLRANRAWQDAELATYNTKTWFWWANSQQRAVVGKAKAKERAAANAARGLNKQHEQLLSDAKAQLGLWSEVNPQ